MSNIIQTGSCPTYISVFIQANIKDLCDIYDEGMNDNPDLEKGIMFFSCSENNNKMDVQFMNDEMMSEIIAMESIINLKNDVKEGKKLFFIQDVDHNRVFLIQV